MAHSPLSLALLLLAAGVMSGAPARAGKTRAKLPAFLSGGDVSLLTHEEQRGVVYKDQGVPRDALQIFQSHGWNCLRLRLWAHPTGEGIFVNDLPYTVALGRRIKQAGFTLLLDLHYSDSWADPGHQPKPAAWEGLTFDQLTRQVEIYSHDVLAAMRQGDAMPDIVAVGNEITNGMIWPDGKVSTHGFGNLAALLKAGIAGVKEGAAPLPDPEIMIHIDRGGDWKGTQWFFDNLQKQGVEFDIIGQSFYPFFQGSLAAARETLTKTAERYHKPIMVAETGYPYAGTSDNPAMTYPLTPEGQRQFLADLVSLVRGLPGGLGCGVNYWEPEWIPIPGRQGSWSPKTLFDDHGNALPGLGALKATK